MKGKRLWKRERHTFGLDAVALRQSKKRSKKVGLIGDRGSRGSHEVMR